MINSSPLLSSPLLSSPLLSSPLLLSYLILFCLILSDSWFGYSPVFSDIAAIFS